MARDRLEMERKRHLGRDYLSIDVDAEYHVTAEEYLPLHIAACRQAAGWGLRCKMSATTAAP